ncbi:COG4653 Predicted phage phi-C31 gp36 major capsid-like protein [uncultured Caudovirales phage]|uniref:COG4653 Predicted phage phi-C31 gp36 major capsid-like protein n=1 Tax=uncultured Caudovirales phage TaxID=2100421 RepID=A0A6J5LJH4_9CAUD|nr:COG4653 Predicted phage phi-C31 gp36 major capsid-like protein [uncultured Caudovirales phage]CAB4174345.1 COG4653 Predicted phage phi-C31 gp36 major capsid-like protein [uncultured Caudovirales phage]CAB4192113.1 COG4653 Predicted phage phi-C31 gp36 major capsid-like protein [uncultured Caudovirales phage]
MDVLKAQYDARAKDLEAAKAIVDLCATEDRAMTVDEKVTFDRTTEEFSRRSAMIEELKRMSVHEAEVRASQEGHEDQIRPVGQVVKPSNDVETIRSLARGEIRSADFGMERRDVLTSSTGAPVPTSFYDQVIMLAKAVGPMLEVGTTLNTAGGENLQIPRLSTYSVGTVNAQGATLGESDPAFSAFITLGAFKYGFLTQISRELLEDSGVDILSLLAMNCGTALGFAVNTALTTGTDTTEPNGIVTASGSALIGGTGLATTGAFTYENLVSLYYSLDPAARALPGVGFMAKGSSIAAMRVLKDGAGNFVFQPAMSESTPDRVLGVPLYENPAMAAIAASAKSVIAGHFPSYYVRTVGGIRLDRSDDFAFSSDLITFRCTFRVDGDLPQTSHVKHFVGAAT